MATYLTEEEQVEAIKRFFKQYGASLLLAVLLACGSGFSWRAWQKHQLARNEQAALLYIKMTQSLANEDKPQSEALAQQLVQDYKKSPYAELAALLLARQAMLAGDLEQTNKQLQWVSTQGKHPALRELATLRQARILVEQKQYTQALTLLSSIKGDTYKALIKAIEGDVYLAQGQKQQAKGAYQLALQGLPKGNQMAEVVEKNLKNIGGATQELINETQS